MRNDGHDCEACRAGMWRREALMVALAIVAASLCTAYQAAGAWLEMRLAPVIENQRIEFAARGPRAAAMNAALAACRRCDTEYSSNPAHFTTTERGAWTSLTITGLRAGRSGAR